MRASQPSPRWPRKAFRAALAAGVVAVAVVAADSFVAPAYLAATRLRVGVARCHRPARLAAGASGVNDDDAPSSFRALTKIRLREKADVNSKPTGDVLEEGEIFICSGYKPPSNFDSQGYLRVVGKEGWAFHLGLSGRWAGYEIVEFLDEAVAASDTTRPFETPKYRASTRIFLRRQPDVRSPRTGEVLELGEVFQVNELRQPLKSGGMVYLQVLGREGWAFNKGVAGAWLDKPIVDTLDTMGRIQGPLEANVTETEAVPEALRSASLMEANTAETEAVPEVLRSASLMEDEGIWLDNRAVNRIEDAARDGRDELRKDVGGKQVEARATKEEQHALRAVRRALAKLHFARPDSLDSLCEEVEAVFEKKSSALGSQRLIAREEIDSVLQLAQKRVKSAA